MEIKFQSGKNDKDDKDKEKVEENEINKEKKISFLSNKVNWMEKLKPSSKNKLIQQRFNFQMTPGLQDEIEDSKWGIEAIPLNITEDNNNQSLITQRLSLQLKQSKKDETNVEFFMNHSNIKHSDEFSICCETDFENINNEIGNLILLINKRKNLCLIT